MKKTNDDWYLEWIKQLLADQVDMNKMRKKLMEIEPHGRI